MNKLSIITCSLFLIFFSSVHAQTGITKFTLNGNVNNMPTSLYTHNGTMYFSVQNPNAYSKELWEMQLVPKLVKGTVNNNGKPFPNFCILGGIGDSLILLVYTTANTSYTEGVYAYDIVKDQFHLISQQQGLLTMGYNALYLKEDKAYFIAETTTGKAIYRHTISTAQTDIFCHLRDDITSAQLINANGKYYFSQHWVDVPNSKVYNNIYAIDTLGKTLSTQSINPENSDDFIYMTHIMSDLYFFCYTQQYDIELYKYNGSGSAQRLTDMSSNNVWYKYHAPQLGVYKGKIYFSGTDGAHEDALFEYDPSTKVAKFIYQNNNRHTNTNNKYYLSPKDFYVYNDKLFFAGMDDSTTTYQPYLYDGVNPPKNMSILSLAGSSFSQAPKNYHIYKQGLYFSATDYANNLQLYRFADSPFVNLRKVINNVSPVSIKVYPNPAHNIFGVSVPEGCKYVTVLDINGREINRFYCNNKKDDLVINMAEQPRGMYIIEAVTNKGISRGRIVLK